MEARDPIRCIAVFEVADAADRDAAQAAWTASDVLQGFGGGDVFRRMRTLPVPSDEPGFKLRKVFGVGQFWVDGVAAATELCRSLAALPETAGLDWLAGAKVTALATREVAIIDGPRLRGCSDGIKGFYFSGRKPGMSVEAFQDHWLNVHGPLVVPSPGISRYVQCHPCPETYETLEPRFDSLAVLTFPSKEAQAVFAASDDNTIHQRNDLPNLWDMTGRALRFYVEDMAD
jgi:hypothetical protein